MIAYWLLASIPEFASLPESKKQEAIRLYNKNAWKRYQTWRSAMLSLLFEVLIIYLLIVIEPIQDWLHSQPNMLIQWGLMYGISWGLAMALFFFLYLVQMKSYMQIHIKTMNLK